MWLDDDYETAAMWQTEQDLKCPGCSQPKDETWVFDPELQSDQEARFRAVLRKCVACAHLDYRRDQHANDGFADRNGIWPTLERTGDG